jgi:hypothetical protein
MLPKICDYVSTHLESHQKRLRYIYFAVHDAYFAAALRAIEAMRMHGLCDHAYDSASLLTAA